MGRGRGRKGLQAAASPLHRQPLAGHWGAPSPQGGRCKLAGLAGCQQHPLQQGPFRQAFPPWLPLLLPPSGLENQRTGEGSAPKSSLSRELTQPSSAWALWSHFPEGLPSAGNYQHLPGCPEPSGRHL